MKKINHPTRLRPFNYGYINKHDWEYRNALRQCRRNKKQYGAAFDNCEAYQLANAICLFMLTHNYPVSKPYLYFKAQGVYKEELFVLHPHFPKDFGGENWVDEYEKVDAVAKEVICNDIAALDAEHKNELLQFILPRLQFIVDKESLCPDDCGGPNHGKWLDMIKAMNTELKDGNMNLFLKNMWLLYSCDWSLLDEEDLEYYCSIYDEEITD